MVVVDEIHTTKNPTSAQGKNLLKLNGARFKIGATGTLLMNNPLDMYVPLKWIGADRSTYTNFKYYYCRYGGIFGNELVGFKNIDTLKSQLDKYSLRRSKDILSLPPKTIINEYVDMNTNQMNFYDNIKDGIISQVDKVKMSTANLLAMIARLRQATVLPSMLTTEPIQSSKIIRAVDLAEQILNGGDKVVIFSTFKQPVYELYNHLEKFGAVIGTGDSKDADIENAIYNFQNNDNVRVFLGTWSKCGTGITLTQARYMIFLDTPWTNSAYEQAQDRIYRIGTSKPVFIYNLIANESIDERVLEIITDKKYLSDYVIDGDISPQGLESLRKYIEELS
jgi:SNF2 family DNA or RNA helicase